MIKNKEDKPWIIGITILALSLISFIVFIALDSYGDRREEEGRHKNHVGLSYYPREIICSQCFQPATQQEN